MLGRVGRSRGGILVYDGGTYAIDSTVAGELVDRGVIAPSALPGHYALALEHVIEEVEPHATVLSRLTGTLARSQGPDLRSVAAGLTAPNGFGGRR